MVGMDEESMLSSLQALIDDGDETGLLFKVAHSRAVLVPGCEKL